MLTHSNIKLYKCSHCSYECNRKGNLKKHMFTHASVKLFKCSDCSYECNYKVHLKQHMLTHRRKMQHIGENENAKNYSPQSRFDCGEFKAEPFKEGEEEKKINK
ncbi:UNVERIFIED_CONTAM: hypothetical protein RMT77_012710 [Armadillidium vulgare]